jgi:two-component system nitrate/nitrite response regulator NarL
MSGPRVLLADDHVPTRDSVRNTLSAGGLHVVAEAGNGSDAVAAAVATVPDLCVLDVCMPGSGVAAAREIARRVPAARIVMLTAHPYARGCLEAVSAGADGYLTKDMDTRRFVHVLREVLAGRPAIPRAYTGPLLVELRERPRRRAPWLHR